LEFCHAVELPAVSAAEAKKSAGTQAAGDSHPDATLAIYEFICGKAVSTAEAKKSAGTQAAGDTHPDATLAIYEFICGKRS